MRCDKSQSLPLGNAVVDVSQYVMTQDQNRAFMASAVTEQSSVDRAQTVAHCFTDAAV